MREGNFRIGNVLVRFFPAFQEPGEKTVSNGGNSELRELRIIRVRNADGKHVRPPKKGARALGEIRMGVGNEKDGGFRADVFRNRRPRRRGRKFRRRRNEIFPKGRNETARIGMGKRGLQYSETPSRIRDGSRAVSRSDSACRDEFENGYRHVESGFAFGSKTHWRGNVQHAPNGDFPIGYESFYERFS